MRKFELVVPCHFGMEAIMKREIYDLGYEITRVEDGRVTFEGDEEAICRANVFLRSGERVLLQVGRFKATTFDELFEILTLKQLGRDKKAIAIVNTNGYYDDIINMLNRCVKEKFMFEKSLELFKVFDDATEAIEYIENYKGELASIKEMKSIKI